MIEQLLPKFCDYYSYSAAGFRSETLNRISEHDRKWFLEALATGVVVQDEAFFRSALSGAKEQVFWQGAKSASPRSISVWAEPIITIGAAGRLYSEFGWPCDQIGLQSKGSWAFDLVAYDHAHVPLVVCEVKKSEREIDDLVYWMALYLSQPPLPAEPRQQKQRNAYRKVVGLRQMGPGVFWSLGPNNYSKVFRLVPGPNSSFEILEEVDEGALAFCRKGEGAQRLSLCRDREASHA